jgi:hypothetical protein
VVAVEEQATLLSNGVSALAFSGEQPSGFLGLRVREQIAGDRERWAEAAMFAVAPGSVPGRVIAQLLKTATPALIAHGVTSIVCLTGYGWLQDALTESGFVISDQVITYTRSNLTGC